MNESDLAWLTIGLYVLLGIAITMIAKRKLGQGMNDFFLGNRQIGGFISALTYAATTYSAYRGRARL